MKVKVILRAPKSQLPLYMTLNSAKYGYKDVSASLKVVESNEVIKWLSDKSRPKFLVMPIDGISIPPQNQSYRDSEKTEMQEYRISTNKIKEFSKKYSPRKEIFTTSHLRHEYKEKDLKYCIYSLLDKDSVVKSDAISEKYIGNISNTTQDILSMQTTLVLLHKITKYKTSEFSMNSHSYTKYKGRPLNSNNRRSILEWKPKLETEIEDCRIKKFKTESWAYLDLNRDGEPLGIPADSKCFDKDNYLIFNENNSENTLSNVGSCINQLPDYCNLTTSFTDNKLKESFPIYSDHLNNMFEIINNKSCFKETNQEDYHITESNEISRDNISGIEKSCEELHQEVNNLKMDTLTDNIKSYREEKVDKDIEKPYFKETSDRMVDKFPTKYPTIGGIISCSSTENFKICNEQNYLRKSYTCDKNPIKSDSNKVEYSYNNNATSGIYSIINQDPLVITSLQNLECKNTRSFVENFSNIHPKTNIIDIGDDDTQISQSNFTPLKTVGGQTKLIYTNNILNMSNINRNTDILRVNTEKKSSIPPKDGVSLNLSEKIVQISITEGEQNPDFSTSELDSLDSKLKTAVKSAVKLYDSIQTGDNDYIKDGLLKLLYSYTLYLESLYLKLQSEGSDKATESKSEGLKVSRKQILQQKGTISNKSVPEITFLTKDNTLEKKKSVNCNYRYSRLSEITNIPKTELPNLVDNNDKTSPQNKRSKSEDRKKYGFESLSNIPLSTATVNKSKLLIDANQKLPLSKCSILKKDKLKGINLGELPRLVSKSLPSRSTTIRNKKVLNINASTMSSVTSRTASLGERLITKNSQKSTSALKRIECSYNLKTRTNCNNDINVLNINRVERQYEEDSKIKKKFSSQIKLQKRSEKSQNSSGTSIGNFQELPQVSQYGRNFNKHSLEKKDISQKVSTSSDFRDLTVIPSLTVGGPNQLSNTSYSQCMCSSCLTTRSIKQKCKIPTILSFSNLKQPFKLSRYSNKAIETPRCPVVCNFLYR
ncbi:uncharacterized protein CMU_033510 [Cryptosporidium muris RN66]|uniref:Uncharacterized protein n=1 Tax=Cryptosporidium muris (strain RN66) TaxID=441375 RepID=B6AFH5_CRYMR|nr:uncharacterized protein CMU_033510 [Cryptosporidium muris RN66]EEA06966.1 hypothetical protein CMU_033510 [Cryptosporidium muris RN66]|eukprot:XP_002141315.1 hypothetical protein [Cryptosporidium muris RN66]